MVPLSHLSAIARVRRDAGVQKSLNLGRASRLTRAVADRTSCDSRFGLDSRPTIKNTTARGSRRSTVLTSAKMSASAPSCHLKIRCGRIFFTRLASIVQIHRQIDRHASCVTANRKPADTCSCTDVHRSVRDGEQNTRAKVDVTDGAAKFT